MMQKARFTLDAFGDQLLEGYDTGDMWNGFACPTFTFDQAQKVAEASNASGLPAHYHAEADEFIFVTNPTVSPDDPTYEDNVDRFGATRIDGVKIYPIGSRSWTWWNANWE